MTRRLRLPSDRRDQLSRERNRIVCRLHDQFRDLREGGAKVNLTADQAARLLQGTRPVGLVATQRRQLARESLADLRRVDKQLADIDARIREAVTATETCLTDFIGIGAVLAATIIGHTRDVTRFADRGHFASYAGVAPIEASSGDVRRHRLSRRGNRRLNAAIHMVALGQISHPSPGRVRLSPRAEWSIPSASERSAHRPPAPTASRRLYPSAGCATLLGMRQRHDDTIIIGEPRPGVTER